MNSHSQIYLFSSSEMSNPFPMPTLKNVQFLLNCLLTLWVLLLFYFFIEYFLSKEKFNSLLKITIHKGLNKNSMEDGVSFVCELSQHQC